MRTQFSLFRRIPTLKSNIQQHHHHPHHSRHHHHSLSTMTSSLILPSVTLKKTPLNCSQSLKTHNFSSFVGFKNGGILQIKPRNDGARVFMSVSARSPSQTAVNDALFSDYKPSSAFLFPGQVNNSPFFFFFLIFDFVINYDFIVFRWKFTNLEYK